MNPALETAANHFADRKNILLERWRELVRSDSSLPEQRLNFTDEELDDHLPALLDAIINTLRGQEVSEETIRQRGAVHGQTRRAHGYSITQLIREFAIFRKLLRQAVEELTPNNPLHILFAARERILEVADRSEIGSVHQYVENANLERDAAREELRAANEHKDRFLAVLSHELRNPLAAISTAIYLARSPGSSEAQRQWALQIVERQASYQRMLVDDLLDVNRISQGKIALNKEQVDLRNTIENAIDTYLPAIEAKAIKFRFARPDQQLMLFADPVRIEQIVSNLLANALKFTSSDGAIEILLRQEQPFAVISVRDTRAGVEPSDLERLFGLFVQGQSKTDPGLGVGLWLAKTLVEMHGGTIEAKSEGVDHGIELIVRLPLVPRPERKAAVSTRVLLVEDDPEQRELMIMALSALDAEIVGARDGAEAIRFASENRFNVCILDLNLPDMSGYNLVGRLLEIHGNNRPRTIALTGFGRPEDAEWTKRAGFDHHVVKPADITELQRIIRQSER